MGPEWGPRTWDKVTGNAANPVFVAASAAKAKQVEADKKRKATDEAKAIRRASKHAKANDDSLQARRDYARNNDGPGVQEVDSNVPQAYLEDLLLDYFRGNVSVIESKLLDIEMVTRGQSTLNGVTTNLWLTERRKRITSSVMGTIAKHRTTTKVASLVKTLLYNYFRGNAATQYGHDQEAHTRDIYRQTKRTSSPGIWTQPSGLVIHPTHHWLAASPDDLVTDPSSPDPLGIAEYKNPYKYKSTLLIDVATQAKDFFLTYSIGSLCLKCTHTYYYHRGGGATKRLRWQIKCSLMTSCN